MVSSNLIGQYGKMNIRHCIVCVLKAILVVSAVNCGLDYLESLNVTNVVPMMMLGSVKGIIEFCRRSQKNVVLVIESNGTQYFGALFVDGVSEDEYGCQFFEDALLGTVWGCLLHGDWMLGLSMARRF